jgi:hypothetical protein
VKARAYIDGSDESAVSIGGKVAQVAASGNLAACDEVKLPEFWFCAIIAFAARSTAVCGGVTRSGWYVGDAGKALWVLARLVCPDTLLVDDSVEGLSATSTTTTNTTTNGAATNNFMRTDRQALIS